MSSTTATTAAALPVVQQDERKKRAAWRPLAAAAIAGSVLVTTGFGVWASLSASATNTTPQNVETGTLKLEMANNGVGFSQAISNLAPQDVVHRFITLTNTGTLEAKDLTLAVAAAGGTSHAVLTGTTDKALQVSVTGCATAWTTAGACAGDATTPVLAPTAIGNLSTAKPLGTTGPIASLKAHHLRITVALPDHTEHTVNGVLPTGTVQAASTNLTWTFNEVQRAGTTTSS